MKNSGYTDEVKIQTFALLLLIPALTACFGKTHTAAQDRMKFCSSEAKAKGLKKEDRAEFMKTCLTTHPGADAATETK